MAVTLTVAQLEAALGIDTEQATPASRRGDRTC